jgi:Fur family ferric uptake transcriptional regulator
MEHARHQGRAQDLAHLLAAHARLQRLHLLARHEVALDDVDLVGSDCVGHTAAGTVEAATSRQDSDCGADPKNAAQAGVATGLVWHGEKGKGYDQTIVAAASPRMGGPIPPQPQEPPPMTNIDELKSTGLKATLPRLKIMEIFQKGVQRHMTAEDVFRVLLEERSDIGLATVYRVLTQFEQAGILIRSNFESGKAVYELNEGQHHDHFVCTSCGKVEEFYDAEIEKRQQLIAKAKGWVVPTTPWRCTASAPIALRQVSASGTKTPRRQRGVKRRTQPPGSRSMARRWRSTNSW